MKVTITIPENNDEFILEVNRLKDKFGCEIEIKDESEVKSPIETIRGVVFDYYGIDPSHKMDKNRKREIVQARQVSMYFCKGLTKESLAIIGDEIGGKDHSTVLHACKTVNNLMDTDRVFKGQVEKIEKKLSEINL